MAARAAPAGFAQTIGGGRAAGEDGLASCVRCAAPQRAALPPRPADKQQEKPKHPLLLGWCIDKGDFQPCSKSTATSHVTLAGAVFYFQLPSSSPALPTAPSPRCRGNRSCSGPGDPAAIAPPAPARRAPPEQDATEVHACQEMVGRQAGFPLSNAAAMAGGERAQEHRAAGLGAGPPKLTSEPQRGGRETGRRQRQHRGVLLVWGHGAALERAVHCS